MGVAIPEMCVFCFSVLISKLTTGSSKPPTPTFTNAPYPVFVSWHLRGSDGKYDLKGCIGEFTPAPLHEILERLTIKSAFMDRRFTPITLTDLPNLQLGLSILRDFEKGTNYMDWEVGVHGIDIEFSMGQGTKGQATFLPEVPIEHKLSKMETIHALIRKTGFKGKITQEILDSIQLTRYQSDQIKQTYSDYQKLTQEKKSKN